jgi:hypothetical protein
MAQKNIQQVNNRTTLIKIQVQNTGYVAGGGSSTIFETLCVPLGKNAAGENIMTEKKFQIFIVSSCL